MFCALCGNKISENHRFCCKCGTASPVAANGSLDLPGVSTTQSSVDVTRGTGTSSTATFENFQMMKSKERASNFRPAGKAAKRKKVAANVDETGDVKVNIGIMFFDGSELKPQRGKNLPIKVPKASLKNDILNAGLAKHKAHFHNMIKDGTEYVLLYPDGTKVDTLKESDDDFVLYKYKAEYGKSYHRISFFICSSRDHAECSIASLALCLVKSSSESDVESENEDSLENKTSTLTTGRPTMAMSSATTTGSSCSPTLASSSLTATVASSVTTTVSSSSLIMESSCNRSITATSSNASVAPSVDSSMTPITPPENRDCTNELLLTEMFPQLSPADAREALLAMNNNLEAAVNSIVSSLPQSTTHEEVYAAFDFCNNIEDDPEFLENDNSVSDINIPTADEQTIKENENARLHEMIADLANKKLKKDSSLRIKVRRSHVWEDAKMKMNRCSDEDLENVIRVQFVGEPAVDQGGPKREFFSLLHKCMNESTSMFVGESNNKCFSNNVVALEQQDYMKYGKLCAMAIIQGSPSPSFFAPSVVDYLLYG